MDKKIELYKSILKVGDQVKLKDNYEDIHFKLDNNGSVGWNKSMDKYSEQIVTIMKKNKNIFTFTDDWITYYECLDTNFKPR